MRVRLLISPGIRQEASEILILGLGLSGWCSTSNRSVHSQQSYLQMHETLNVLIVQPSLTHLNLRNIVFRNSVTLIII